MLALQGRQFFVVLVAPSSGRQRCQLGSGKGNEILRFWTLVLCWVHSELVFPPGTAQGEKAKMGPPKGWMFGRNQNSWGGILRIDIKS